MNVLLFIGFKLLSAQILSFRKMSSYRHNFFSDLLTPKNS